MAGAWNPLDLMMVRDVAISDNVPRMSELESQPMSGRTPYALGHATWEFIEARWGKEGLRQFLFSLRKSAIGGGESAYEEALKLKPEDFDDAFDRYLKERFKPFRDKERPADYGRNLAPRPGRSDYVSVITLEPSPSGDMLAAVVGNMHDQELDIILLSSRDGQIIRNLTPGLDKNRGFEYIATAGGLRGNVVPWIAWSPVGDRLAYFVRTEKDKTLIVENVVNRKTEFKIKLSSVDEPESPAFSPDGTKIAFSALKDGSATSTRSSSAPTRSRTSPRTPSRITRRRSRPTARRSSTRRGSAAITSCSRSMSRPARRSSSPSARTTTPRPSSTTTTSSCSRRRRSIRRCSCRMT
jgi:hypothetical protein